MFTVAKAILEVLTVLQELNVIRSAFLLLCLELGLPKATGKSGQPAEVNVW